MALLPSVTVPVPAGCTNPFEGVYDAGFSVANPSTPQSLREQSDVEAVRRKLEATAILSGAFTPPRGTKKCLIRTKDSADFGNTPNTLASTPDGGLPPLVDDDDDDDDDATADIVTALVLPDSPPHATCREPVFTQQQPPAYRTHTEQQCMQTQMQPSQSMQGRPFASPEPHQVQFQQQQQHQWVPPQDEAMLFHYVQQQQFLAIQQQQQQQQHQQHTHHHQQQGMHYAPSVRSGSSCGSYLSSRTPSPQDQPLLLTPAGSQAGSSPQLVAHIAPDELPRESEACREGRVTLLYAPPRGTATRVSWRNKLWSNTTLLQSRFGGALPRYFRENYADRSPTSEPLLHNNYPSGSRVYFQGRITLNHCVCHHLVQVFEAFSVTADQRPDPVGLQALWIAPSQASGRVYGYAKFVDPRMAAAAVVGLRNAAKQACVPKEPAVLAAPPRDESLDVVLQVASLMVPPATVGASVSSEGFGQWSPKALAVARMYNAFSTRYRGGAMFSAGNLPPVPVVQAAMNDVEDALARTFGEGIVTAAFVDGVTANKTCPHYPSPPPSEPIFLEDISLANEQRPGHRAKPMGPQ